MSRGYPLQIFLRLAQRRHEGWSHRFGMGKRIFFLCVEEETEKRSCTLRDKGGPGSLALGANSLTLSDLDRRRRSSGNASTCANIEASERRESWGEKRKYDSWTREFDEERERDAAYSI